MDDQQPTLPDQPRYWRTVEVWHEFFCAWRPWEYEGSHDGTTWFPIARAPIYTGSQQMDPRRRTDITDD